ncbi:MAG: erythromycin esterase family protein [Acidobacteria bacterium]|nr:MAG: erythromycin esterase family protein [Acidobacteriota bacterium]
MPEVGEQAVIKAINSSALPLTNQAEEYNALVDRMAEASFVLIGEASHGTHEFYQQRAEITRRLIREKGFRGVAIEADWPDTYRVHRYVTNKGAIKDTTDSLGGFRHFPTWLWRNRVVEDFIEWLRAHNDSLPPDQPKVGFFGLDLYGLYSSIKGVLDYLRKVDPPAAERARFRYSCFDHFGENTEAYGYAAGFELDESCEKAVIDQLTDLQKCALDYLQRDGRVAAEEYFHVLQNARLVKDAEKYYREMFRGKVSSWNIRDTHMAETLEALAAHFKQRGEAPKLVVWAHNSHIGDATATEFGQQGEVNLGQLVREKHHNDCFLLGFTTCKGSVTAASDWGAPAETKKIRPAMRGSYEELFHRTGIPRFLITLWDYEAAIGELKVARLERAIGVIYRPESERVSHYFYARLSDQFDAVIHIDQTRAVEALETAPQPLEAEVAETFPSGV